MKGILTEASATLTFMTLFFTFKVAIVLINFLNSCDMFDVCACLSSAL